jgi:hypothetical protein
MTIDNILASIDSEIAQLKQARALLSGDGALDISRQRIIIKINRDE